MGETDTYEVETQFGPTEIETYECDSCGNRVAYENTVEFTIGKREGRACEHCKETGPISFPRKVVDFAMVDVDYGGTVFGLLFAIPATLVIIEEGLSEDKDFEKGILFGYLVMFVWVILPLVLYIIL